MKKVAIPLQGEKLSAHFGHCEQFLIVEMDDEKVQGESRHTPPQHAPGVYPRWLAGMGVHEIIAGSMGQKATALFNQNKIQVHLGVPEAHYQQIITDYMENAMVTGDNRCDH